jgi:hypothetical protein
VRRLAALLVLSLLPHPAEAAELRAAVEGGYFELSSARSSARAVFGSAGGPSFGLSVGFATGESGPFGRVGVRRWRRSGERLFAVDTTSPIFRLGHPLEVQIVPIYALVGGRLRLGPARPYVGYGVGLTAYREESTVAEITTRHSRWHPSFRLVGGVELPRGRWRLGLELDWSSVPRALGGGGIAERFDETNAGGISLMGRIVFVP